MKVHLLPGTSTPTLTPLPGVHNSFHRIETTTVIVDDCWVLVGSSTFSRRGLCFDGGSNLVFTDQQLNRGVSAAIQTFRRNIMASRLGFPATVPSQFGQPLPHPNFTRLNDGVEAFRVIREMLVAGGLGKIARLWNGQEPGVNTPPATIDQASPDGREVGLLEALAIAVFAQLSGN